MPEISGFELLELLRSSNVGNSKSIPISRDNRFGQLQQGGTYRAWICRIACLKPFSISELMEITDKCAIKQHIG